MSERASNLYKEMVLYLIDNGWRREELGSGWWWNANVSGGSEADLEEAVGVQLQADGVDLRTMLDGEPQEFWG